MHKAALYSRASDLQRHDAKEIVAEYAATLKLHSDGKEALLDVGTGSGDVLIEILVPVLAHGFPRITGIDISPKMVEFSSKTFGHLDGVDFKELDIEVEDLPLEYHEQFDRVTSFYCLHWIKDQKKSLENIYKSLRKNGDCLLMFPGAKSTYDAYKILSKKSRWAHLKDVTQVFSPIFEQSQIGDEYAELLEQVGFIDRRVEIKTRTFVYEGLANFKENMKAVNPFGLSDADDEEFYEALCDCFNSMGLREQIPGTEDYRFFFKYRLVVAYARKGE